MLGPMIPQSSCSNRFCPVDFMDFGCDQPVMYPGNLMHSNDVTCSTRYASSVELIAPTQSVTRMVENILASPLAALPSGSSNR